MWFRISTKICSNSSVNIIKYRNRDIRVCLGSCDTFQPQFFVVGISFTRTPRCGVTNASRCMKASNITGKFRFLEILAILVSHMN